MTTKVAKKVKAFRGTMTVSVRGGEGVSGKAIAEQVTAALRSTRGIEFGKVKVASATPRAPRMAGQTKGGRPATIPLDTPMS